MNGQPRQQTYQTNGMANVLTADGSISDRVSFSKNASYSGFGWGNQGPTEGWQFRSDIGVAYQGQINVMTAGEGVLSQPGFSGLIQAEQAQLLSTLSRYRWHLVLQVGMAYRF
ncbi:MAG: hypothetical protein ACYCSR_15660 [Thiomonas sp.]